MEIPEFYLLLYITLLFFIQGNSSENIDMPVGLIILNLKEGKEI